VPVCGWVHWPVGVAVRMPPRLTSNESYLAGGRGGGAIIPQKNLLLRDGLPLAQGHELARVGLLVAPALAEANFCGVDVALGVDGNTVQPVELLRPLSGGGCPDVGDDGAVPMLHANAVPNVECPCSELRHLQAVPFLHAG